MRRTLVRLKNLFLVFICALVGAIPCYSETSSCIGGDTAYDTASIFLIDGSESIELNTGFQQSLNVVFDSIVPKERVIVAVVTERKSNVKVLLDLVRPVESVWESKLIFQKKLKTYRECTAKILEEVKTETAKKYKNSAILETLQFAKEIFSSVPSNSKKLYMYSDMIEHSDTISFYKLGPKETEKTLLDKVIAQNLMTDLLNVTVKVAGVGGTQSDKDARRTEQFWRMFFEKSGATLSFYGPVLVR